MRARLEGACVWGDWERTLLAARYLMCMANLSFRWDMLEVTDCWVSDFWWPLQMKGLQWSPPALSGFFLFVFLLCTASFASLRCAELYMAALLPHCGSVYWWCWYRRRRCLRHRDWPCECVRTRVLGSCIQSCIEACIGARWANFLKNSVGSRNYGKRFGSGQISLVRTRISPIALKPKFNTA